MVFVRKFLLFSLLLAFSINAQQDLIPRFRQLYYAGDYAKAHDLVGSIHAGNWKQQVWDERIHAQSDLPGCPIRERRNPSAEGMALLRIGDFASARQCFGGDWLSEFGRATLADWENNHLDSREAIRRAMALSPRNPDLLYFAAGIAPTREMTLDFYGQFLELPDLDSYQREVASFAMEFIKKTWDIPLNVPEKITGIERIESDYRSHELIIQGKINGHERVSLLLDTGAGGMTLREKDWHPQLTSDVMTIGIGKKQTSRSTRLVLNTFEAGHYQLKNPVASMSAEMPLAGADGIAGTAIFSNHYMLVPMKAGADFTLFTCDRQDPLLCMPTPFAQKTTLPFYCINRLIILKGRVRNSPDNLDILLDTGASRTILSTATARRYARINYPLSRQFADKLTLSGIGGKTDQALIAENVEVALGPIRKEFNTMAAMNLGESSEAMELELDVILGRDFLEGYTLLIDYENNRVTFLK
jgi:hypothetical protein